jgi:hypothetical protein
VQLKPEEQIKNNRSAFGNFYKNSSANDNRGCIKNSVCKPN